MSDWDQQQIETLKALWPNYSSHQIARMMSRGRSSICGKVRRLVALGELQPKIDDAEIQRRATAKERRLIVSASAQDAARQKQGDAAIAGGVPMIALGYHHCRFPLWPHIETGAPDFLHCGHAKVVGPYCVEHHRLCNQRQPATPEARAKSREAARAMARTGM